MAPAWLQVNRRNAQKSTGPGTTRGKVQSRKNGLRTPRRSSRRGHPVWALLNAAPCCVDTIVREEVWLEQVVHPMSAELVKMAPEAHTEVATDVYGDAASKRKKIVCFFDARSLNLIENTKAALGMS